LEILFKDEVFSRQCGDLTKGRSAYLTLFGNGEGLQKGASIYKKAFFVEKPKGCICGEKTAIVGRIHASFEGRHAEEIRSFAERTDAAFPFLQTAAQSQPFSFGRKKPHDFLKDSRDKFAEK
jgi:hypothetical protein